MYSWLWLVIASGILLGFSDITKKETFKKNSVITVLALYSIFSFLFVSFEFSNAINLGSDKILIILFKTFIVFLVWILSFTAIKNLPISVITPFDTLNPMFSIIFGVVLLNEKLALFQFLGIFVMLLSYYFIGKVGSKEVTRIFRNKYFYFMIISAVLNAVSATIDKIVLKTVNPGQMQFWFSLFMAIFYIVSLIFMRCAGKDKSSIKFDYHIPVLSMLMILSDRVYFMALNIPSSEISIVMPLRKVSIFVSVIIGGLIFKEKNLKQKFWCICLLIFGILLLFA
ncbi:putative membrane protein [Clostridium algifaecis]|uniref:Membrane protein n=1 Tax=Clostridium algifaecis TaxID=1472040 RepID=A0ABS4KPY3_9CLOT|nr:DMT family transporter [Clostridium algifaecis]MBP2032101.1 putative membrane protein [Clostridium algifaecis]